MEQVPYLNALELFSSSTAPVRECGVCNKVANKPAGPPPLGHFLGIYVTVAGSLYFGPYFLSHDIGSGGDTPYSVGSSTPFQLGNSDLCEFS